MLKSLKPFNRFTSFKRLKTKESHHLSLGGLSTNRSKRLFCFEALYNLLTTVQDWGSGLAIRHFLKNLDSMARLPRLEFSSAIDHLTRRGSARQRVFLTPGMGDWGLLFLNNLYPQDSRSEQSNGLRVSSIRGKRFSKIFLI